MISVVLRSPLPGTYVTVKFPILSSPTAFSIPPTFHEPSIRNAALSFVNNWNVSSSFAVNVLSGKYPFSYNVLKKHSSYNSVYESFISFVYFISIYYD